MKYLVVVIATIFVTLSLFIFIQQPKPAVMSEQIKLLDGEKYFEATHFYDGIKKNKNNPIQTIDSARGLIVPHHLIAGELISEAFHHINPDLIDTVILLGPNHYELGTAPVITSASSWDTTFGLLASSPSISQFTRSELITIDDITIQNDHSITGLIPYIKYYLPEVKIVPLLISNRMDQNQITQLANLTSKGLNNRTLILLSVDFSHQNTSDNARQFDKITWEYIKNNNSKAIRKLNNNYLDAPTALSIYLEIFNDNSNTFHNLIRNTDSGQMTGKIFSHVTSYFTIISHDQ